MVVHQSLLLFFDLVRQHLFELEHLAKSQVGLAAASIVIHDASCVSKMEAEYLKEGCGLPRNTSYRYGVPSRDPSAAVAHAWWYLPIRLQ